MRRKSNARILFWPSLAASAIILVLLSSTHIQNWMGTEQSSDRFATSTTQTSDAIPSPLPPPRPLTSNQNPDATIAYDLARPADMRNQATSRPRPLDVDTESMLAAPTSDSPTIVLKAPVFDDNEELAGFAPPTIGNSPKSQTRTVSTKGEGGSNIGEWGSALAKADRTYSNSSTNGPARDGNAENVKETVRDADAVVVEDTADDSAAEYKLGQDLSASIDSAKDNGAAIGSKPAGVAWPRTPALNDDLSSLQMVASNISDDQLQVWINQVRAALLDLQAVPSITDARAGALIAHLRNLADLGIELGETSIDDRQQQQQVLRTAHSLLRRSVVWNAVWSVGDHRVGQTISLRLRDVEPLIPTVHKLRQQVAETGDPQGWTRFLLLDEIEQAADTTDADARRIIAQRLLSRVAWPGLNERHKQWLDDSNLYLLTNRIRSWADSPVDYAALLAQIERQESDALDMGGIDVATAVQNLRFSESEPTAAVAAAINDYYRNANLRMAVSAELLDQLLPEVPARTSPIRQTLVGMPVRGTGTVNSQLGIQLVPATGSWNLLLNSSGTIAATTGTQQWPVQISNRSTSYFDASTPIRIDNQTVTIGDTKVGVTSKVALRGMKTEFDGFPVIESLVRAIAMSRYRETAPTARRQSEALTRNQISEQVSEEVESKINQASDQLASRLLGPLGRLQLDPLVVDLDTTESRLSARYRIAGDWQLAAFKPRPRALSNSVLSMQIHQSLLNNTFEQLLPSDSAQPIREMMARVLGMFGVDPNRIPGELPSDIHIRFASTRPVTVEIEDGLLWLTLRVVRLHDNAGLDLNYFVVRAAFRPEFDGLNAQLVRDGVLRISGPRMGIRERLPVRAIFTKVLDDSRPLPLVSDQLVNHPAANNLKVGMLDLVDGWLCLAICPKDTASTSGPAIAEEEAPRRR